MVADYNRARPSECNALFFKLCEAAKTGDRAPVVKGNAYGTLARDGKILIEISGHNWRQVTILTGDQAGKKTKANPLPSRIYMVVDCNGARRLTGQETDDRSKT